MHYQIIYYLHDCNFNIAQSNDANYYDDDVSCLDSAARETAATLFFAHVQMGKVLQENLFICMIMMCMIMQNFQVIKKPIGRRCVFKTTTDPIDNVKRSKARLVAKAFTQREGIDINYTYQPVSSKGSFRIIMVLIVYFDLELHQTDVKSAISNASFFK